MPRKVLLLGKTGCGKSSLGNLLTGRASFPVSYGMFASSVADCQRGDSEDRTWTVVDTPDVASFLDNPLAVQKLVKKAHDLIKNETFDAVLLITRLDVRFTEEEKLVLDVLTRTIWQQYGHCIIVVFSHGDCIGSDEEKFRAAIHDFRKQQPFMDKLLEECSGRLTMIDLSARCPDALKLRQRDRLLQFIADINQNPGRPKSQTGSQPNSPTAGPIQLNPQSESKPKPGKSNTSRSKKKTHKKNSAAHQKSNSNSEETKRQNSKKSQCIVM